MPSESIVVLPSSLILFASTDALDNTSLWVTNGLPGGASELSITGAEPVRPGLDPTFLTLLGSEALFAGYGTDGYNLWVTDGTAAGTSELSVAGAYSSGLAGGYMAIAPIGSEVIFSGSDASGADNLWVTNGTSAGTSELSVAGAYSGGLFGNTIDIGPLPQFTTFGDKVLFAGLDANEDVNLWVTNGTSKGTSELSVASEIPGPFGGIWPSDLTVFGSEVLFDGYDANFRHELWVTDGTAAGTSELSVPTAYAGGLDPQELTVFGSEVLFSGVGFSGQHDLWVTNGTAAGTSELSVQAVDPGEFTVFGSEVLFAGYDANQHVGLWVTDGTAAGTSELLTTTGNSRFGSGLAPHDFAVLGSEVLFAGTDNNGYTGLWVTNGTSAGTSELAVIGSYLNGGLLPSDFVPYGNRLLFEGYDPLGRLTAWVTDGSAAGTSELLTLPAPATVTSVVASPSSGVEDSGDIVTITVGFSQDVTVLSGTPTLTLNNGGIASYNAAATAALNDPTKLVFSYMVGSSSSEHNVGELAVSTNSLSDGAAIRDGGGNTPDFSGLATAFPQLSIIAVLPTTVTSVTASPASGVEGPGAEITITVTMSKAVTVSGAPTLTLNDGGLAFYNAAATAALNDPTKLVFTYTVATSDHNVGELAVQDGNANGAAIVDANGNTPDFSGLTTAFANLQVVTTPPATVISVMASPASGTEMPGQSITVTLTMSKAVSVSGGTPTLALNDGGLAIYDAAATAALNDPTKLVFDYTVGATPGEHNVGELVVVGGRLNGATIVDASGYAPNFSNLPTTFQNLSVVLPPTTVTSVVASPGSGVEGIGAHITITVTMSTAVSVLSGRPELTLNDGGQAVYDAAATAALNDPTKLVFDYIVLATDHNVSELTVQDGSADGATIVDAYGNTPDFSALTTAFQNLSVTVAAPATVTSVVASPASGVEGLDANITFTVTMSKAVTVSGGTPTLSLNDGGTATYNAAATAALNDPAKLVFEYTVKGSDSDVVELAILDGSANGATIVDAAGNTPDFSGLITAFPNLEVVAPPTVASVAASPASGVEGVGASITIMVRMTKAVTVSGGTPTLTLNDGGLAYYNAAATAALNDPTKLVFDYTVAATDHNVGALTVQDASFNGATILDALGITPDLSGLATVFPSLDIVLSPVRVTSVTASPSSGVEGVGAHIAILVNMSGPLTVPGGTSTLGTATLTLNDGGLAYYDAAASTDTTLAFDYTVGATPGEHNVGELTVQGGSAGVAAIVDANGNAPDFSGLATAFQNLSVVVAPPATVTSVVASPTSGTEMPGQGITFTVTMSKGVTVSGGTPTLALNDGGTASYDAAATSALHDPTKLVFDYTVGASDQTVSTLSIVGGSFNGAPIVDAAGNVPDFSGVLTSFPGLGVDPPTAVGAAPTTVAPQGIDLAEIGFGTQTTFAYTPNQSNTGGSLSVSDGTHDASIALLGQYAAGDFRIAGDAHGGTLVSDPKLSGAALTTFLASAHT